MEVELRGRTVSGNGFSSIKNLDALTEAGFSDKQARALLQAMGQDAATKTDLEYATAELKREMKNLDVKIETVRKDLELKIETIRADLKRDIKEMENKMNFKMLGMVLTILSALVTLGKLGMLDPTPHRPTPIEQVRPSLQQ